MSVLSVRYKEYSLLFINPNGVLCYTVKIGTKELFTLIDVIPIHIGIDTKGRIIDENDFVYRSQIKMKQ